MQRLKKLLFASLGMLFLAFGVIGAFLPIIPTVPFLLVAAACFARSSDRLHQWLLHIPMIGQVIRKWRQEGSITRRTKIVAITSLWVSVGFSCVFFSTSWLAICVAALSATGLTLYIASRPGASD
ncbi:MAG: YbaN family protein [bacterium]|nr:YbaN family protein [bacterium]